MTVFFKAPDASHINEFGYDRQKKELIVKYTFGDYRYKDVPNDIFLQLAQTKSKGQFLNSSIKGKYGFEKIEK